jgi:DNA-binding transcriptional regulator YhcF (GntR family)
MQRDKNMERTIFTQKRPQINEETVYRKLVSNTKILELRTLGTFLYI